MVKLTREGVEGQGGGVSNGEGGEGSAGGLLLTKGQCRRSNMH